MGSVIAGLESDHFLNCESMSSDDSSLGSGAPRSEQIVGCLVGLAEGDLTYCFLQSDLGFR
jgi:hypothetical protein